MDDIPPPRRALLVAVAQAGIDNISLKVLMAPAKPVPDFSTTN
jgi:hypothetical protein